MARRTVKKGIQSKKATKKVTPKKKAVETVDAQAHIQKVMDNSRAAIIKKSAREYAKKRK